MSRKIRDRVKLNNKIASVLKRSKTVDKRYQNEDGTFKVQRCPDGGKENKFCGCVNYQMAVGGYSQERAEKICGKIKQQKGGSLEGDATLTKKYDTFEVSASDKFVSEMKKEGLFGWLKALPRNLKGVVEKLSPQIEKIKEQYELSNEDTAELLNLAMRYSYSESMECDAWPTSPSLNDFLNHFKDLAIERWELNKPSKHPEWVANKSDKFVAEMKKEGQGHEESDPYQIARDIADSIREDIKDGTLDNEDDIDQYIKESVDGYIGHFSTCHEIIRNWRGDTSLFDTLGAEGYDTIAQVYAYQILLEETYEELEEDIEKMREVDRDEMLEDIGKEEDEEIKSSKKKANKLERWAFSESELANPEGLNSDDELITIRGIIVYRDGSVSNRYEDGTFGISREEKEEANEEETLYHPEVDEETIAWRPVEVDDNGGFVRFMHSGAVESSKTNARGSIKKKSFTFSENDPVYVLPGTYKVCAKIQTEEGGHHTLYRVLKNHERRILKKVIGRVKGQMSMDQDIEIYREPSYPVEVLRWVLLVPGSKLEEVGELWDIPRPDEGFSWEEEKKGGFHGSIKKKSYIKSEENVVNKDLWGKAIKLTDGVFNEAEERMSEDDYWDLVSHIYSSLGGEFITKASPRTDRGRGKPLTDKERLKRHKKLYPEDDIESEEELPDRGTGLANMSGNKSWKIERVKGSSVVEHYKKIGQIEEYEERKGLSLTQEEAEKLYKNLSE